MTNFIVNEKEISFNRLYSLDRFRDRVKNV